MNFHNIQNNFITTLLVAITSTTQMTITLTATPTISPLYYLSIGNDSLTNPSQCEIVEVISNSSGTLTINRAQQGTTAQLFPSGTKVQILATSGHFNEIYNDLNSTTTELLESTGYGIISGLTTIAQATPTMTVNVASGVVHMPDETRFAPIANSALAISTADTTNPRIDIVYINNTGVISYLAGIPAVTPTVPPTPTGGFLLSQVSVSANATSITNANITDKRKIKNTTDTNANQIAVLSGTSGLAEKTSKSDFDLHLADITNKIATHHRLNVVDNFGADNTGVNDSTSALQAARDYIASQAQPPALVFPAGIYKYSISPNWAIQDAQIIADGKVKLRYTGTGNAVIIDSGAYPASGITHLKFGNFIIECPSTAQHALYIRALHHSEISAKILGAGTAYDAMRMEFAVCNKYNIIVSNNEGGWYLNSKPQNGIHCTKRNTGELTSYCTFINPVLEGLVNGAYLEDAIGNTFIGGTMEGCSSVGCQLGTNALQNKFFNVDFEANTNSDINCNGHDNQFYGCDSQSLMILDLNSYNNIVLGGNYSKINIASGALANTISLARYNSVNDGSTISDLGIKTRLSNNYNVGLTRQENTAPTRTVMTVGASPYTYTNTSGNTEKILVTTGTISSLVYAKAGIGDTSPITSGYFILEPTDFLVITYSVAPALIKYSM